MDWIMLTDWRALLAGFVGGFAGSAFIRLARRRWRKRRRVG